MVQYSELVGRSVVVTGSAGGIGEVAARAFYDQGAYVFLLDIDSIKIEQIASELGDRAFAKPEPIVLIVIGDYFSKALQLAKVFREKGNVCEILYKTNPGKAFKDADKLGARFAIIIGEEEIKNNTIKVKDLSLPQDHPQKERTMKNSQVLEVLCAEHA